jgi:hypothetical protein
VFLNAILEKIVTVNATINEIDDLLEGLPKLDRRTGTRKPPAAVRKQTQGLAKELVTIRRALIDVNYSQAQLWGSGLHEKFNALFDTVDSADFAPALQTREVFDVLSGQLQLLLTGWRKAREHLLPALNRALADASLPITR